MIPLSIFHSKFIFKYRVAFFCLLIAIFLWFYVATDNVFEHEISFPLRISNQPTDFVPVKPLPESVSVRVRGVGKELISLYAVRDREVEINLDGLGLDTTVELHIGMIRDIPSDMNIIPLGIVSPKTVHIQLDEQISRRIPVRSNLRLVPMDSYMIVGDVRLNPDSIIIEGPKTLVDTMHYVSTVASDYVELVRRIEGRVSLEKPAASTVMYSRDKVSFSADIQRIGEIQLTEIPVHISHLPPGIKGMVIPSTLTLELQGGVNVLRQLRKEDVSATIDYRSRHRYPGNRIPATIQVPQDISFSNVQPQFFQLVVER